jgi:8-oxo-dGTP pyrophosphatase MutT (NUDIX family)/predicted RNA-binding Zn-ribbon protein involved in translation (DUF1610 family)
MKINFKIPDDNQYYQFCPECHSENIDNMVDQNKTYYKCADCGKISPRLIIIDPKVKYWIDEATKEYWHESVGIFVFNKNNEALFFKRILFPFVYTIPAGHLDVGENLEEAVKRELFEETGIKINDVKLFSEEDILNDQCRRGADNHRWHLFIARLDDEPKVKINREGLEPIWLSLSEALKKELTIPVKYFIEKHGEDLFLDL